MKDEEDQGVLAGCRVESWNQSRPV